MKNYKIKKGDHYCNANIFERLFAIGWKVKQLSVNFRLARECWWAPPRNSDDKDLNKLVGISYGLNDHSNSVRFAWAPDFEHNGTINIYGYIYDELSSGHVSKFIVAVNVETVNTGVIKVVGNQYVLTVGTTSVSMDNTHGDPNLCFRLYPYFGGNNTAPNDMVIGLDIS
jgi:hypothetical protein